MAVEDTFSCFGGVVTVFVVPTSGMVLAFSNPRSGAVAFTSRRSGSRLLRFVSSS
jgi:hypothetical protein